MIEYKFKDNIKSYNGTPYVSIDKKQARLYHLNIGDEVTIIIQKKEENKK